jgi:hypothetical protein
LPLTGISARGPQGRSDTALRPDSYILAPYVTWFPAILSITFDSSVLGVDRVSEPKARYRARQRMRARQRAAQGLKVSTTQDSRGLVVKSSLCVEDGAIRACQDQSAKRGRMGTSAKSEAKVKPGRRSRPAQPAQPAQPAKSKRVLPCSV